MRWIILAFLLAAPLATAQFRQRTIDLFVPVSPGRNAQLPESPDIRVRYGRDTLEVTSVEPAAAMLASHTVVVLDFLHASPNIHREMLREVLEARERKPEMDWFILAIGPTSEIVDFPDLVAAGYPAFVLPDNRYLSQTASKPPLPGKFQFYWIPQPGENPITPVADLFSAKHAPVRAIWISDDFIWFKSRPNCYLMPAACESTGWTKGAMEDPATPANQQLSTAGLSIFPFIFYNIDADPDRKHSDVPKLNIPGRLNSFSAIRLANDTGGLTVEAKAAGNGAALAKALETTAFGYHVRIHAKFDRPYSQDYLRVDSKALPRLHYQRRFALVAPSLDGPSSKHSAEVIRSVRIPSVNARATPGCPGKSAKEQSIWLQAPNGDQEEVEIMLSYADGLATVQRVVLAAPESSPDQRGACIDLKRDASQLVQLVFYMPKEDKLGLVNFSTR